MLTIHMQGGLGNQLFQLAALESISKRNLASMFLETSTSPSTNHSRRNYFQSIFLEWNRIPRRKLPVEVLDEPSYEFREWKLVRSATKLQGYFQNYKYISDKFLETLWLPNVTSLPGAFLHIRGGDYVQHPLHGVNLESYYSQAIQMFPEGTKFYVFTNDIPYAKTLSFLEKVDYEFVDERDEVCALALMKNCLVGGICANSTFSWWGAYLNRKNRTLVLPSKWFNDPSIYVNGYFFPGSVICPV